MSTDLTSHLLCLYIVTDFALHAPEVSVSDRRSVLLNSEVNHRLDMTNKINRFFSRFGYFLEQSMGLKNFTEVFSDVHYFAKP